MILSSRPLLNFQFRTSCLNPPTFLDADIIFYVFKINDIINNNRKTIERINDDMEHIKDWLGDRQSNPKVFLIGTHCDLDPDFKNINSDNMGEYGDRIYDIQTIENMLMSVGGAKNASLILGTLNTNDGAEKILIQILNSYENE